MDEKLELLWLKATWEECDGDTGEFMKTVARRLGDMSIIMGNQVDIIRDFTAAAKKEAENVPKREEQDANSTHPT